MEENVAKLPQAAATLLGSGGVVSPPTGSGAAPQEPSTYPAKNSSNERRKMVERRTIANPKCVSRLLGKKVGEGGGTFPML